MDAAPAGPVRRFGVFIVLLALAASTASAAKRTKLVTPELERRMPPAAQRNLHATVAVGQGDGSGVVLHRARGLIATNAHVAEEHPKVVHTVDGKVVPVREMIHAVPGSDIAFLRVGRLPKGTTQVAIDPAKPTKGRKLYAINAGSGGLDARRVLAGQHETDPAGFLHAHRKKITAPGAPDGAPILALASHLIANQGNVGYRIFGRGRVVKKKQTGKLEIGGRIEKVSVTETNLPHAEGASGGGVFDEGSHALVAVHTGGAGSSSAEIPVHRVIGAARDAMVRGEVKASKTGLAALSAWLADVAR